MPGPLIQPLPALTYCQWEHRDSRGPDKAFAAALARPRWGTGDDVRDLRALLQLTLITRHELSSEPPPVILGTSATDPNGLEARVLGDPNRYVGAGGVSDAASDSRLRASLVMARTILLLAGDKFPDVKQYVKTRDAEAPSPLSGGEAGFGWPAAITVLGGLVTAGATYIAKEWLDKDERLAVRLQQFNELLKNHVNAVQYVAQRRADAQAKGVPLQFDNFDASILGSLEKQQVALANARPDPPKPGEGLFNFKLDLTAVAAIAAGVAAIVLLRK